MHGVKTDPLKVAKIVEEKLKDPKKSVRDIGKDVDLAHSTVHFIAKREIGQIAQHDEMVKEIIGNDLLSLADGTKLMNRTIMAYLKDLTDSKGLKKTDISKLASALSDAIRRYQLLTGGATDNIAVQAQVYLPEKKG